MPAGQGFLSLFQQGHCRASGINRSKNARLARLSIPFSAGQRLKAVTGCYSLCTVSGKFLSLFQQGKDLKIAHVRCLEVVM